VSPNRRPKPVVRPKFRVGHIQRQIRRLLIVHGAMTTTELARSIYPRPNQEWQHRQVRRSAAKFAVEADRVRSPGAPIVWKLR
jgi:hypothetical protein